MSGHSHAKTVARTKNANAEKRGKIFSKLSKMISVAAKDGGDPAGNSKLKQAIDEAKKANMPKENVERAIKKGNGELAGEQLEEVTYEAIGPNNISLIIEGTERSRK
jgi:transcriptional/translational regulatory protein YebC/TACO1